MAACPAAVAARRVRFRSASNNCYNIHLICLANVLLTLLFLSLYLSDNSFDIGKGKILQAELLQLLIGVTQTHCKSAKAFHDTNFYVFSTRLHDL
jgi:hypothetical protein